MRWIFLLFLMPFSTLSADTVIIKKARQEALIEMLKSMTTKDHLELKQQAPILYALRLSFPACSLMEEPFRNELPEDLRPPLCLELIEAAMNAGLTDDQIEDLIRSFKTADQVKDNNDTESISSGSTARY